MNFIVVDLEWNQPLSYDSSVYRQVGDRLIFEMIQIGAVKLDEHYQVIDSISIPIRPVHYVKIHPRIRRMTQLGAEELADAPEFLEAMDQFAAWCGDDYVLLTWGCDDVSVLKQNMDFFGCEVELPPLCDIQRLFADVNGTKERKGLKVAMEMLDIQPDADRYFHNALHDAYYTALVFGKLPDPAAVLKYPQEPKSLIHPRKHARGKDKGESYDSLTAALESEAARQPRCPVCGKKTKVEDGGYVKQSGDKYIGLSACPHHGNLLIRLRFKPTDDGKRLMIMSVSKATAANRAYVHTKRIQMEEKAAKYLAEHGSLPDPDEELMNADRSSMPFED
ncbi:MAG: exonuclease domain-containing protein [Clostridia bacterium]|nr:exonuclease domain-containing protein [Clostridia bacterium]